MNSGVFASLNDDGKWIGMADEVSRNKYDMIICDMYVSFMREQISAGSIMYDVDYLGIVTAKPTIRPKFLNVIYPFNPNVWIAIFITFVVVTVAFLVISKIEGSMTNVHFDDWSTIPSSLWYVYGTFVGESISRE